MLLKKYVEKISAFKDLVDMKPALADEDDYLMTNYYSELAKESVCLARLAKEFQDEQLRTQCISAEMQVFKRLTYIIN